MMDIKLKTGLLILLFFLLSSFAVAEDTQKETEDMIKVESLNINSELADLNKEEALNINSELTDLNKEEALNTNPELVETKKNEKTINRFLARRTKRKKGKVVKIDFDNELLIKGKVLGPSLFTLYQKRNVEFGRLIQPRKDFLPEMRTTLGDIK